MTALVGGPTTPLENIPDLGEGVVEKLSAAGITTVESLADMTPEELEAIPGIGPKTVEKISIAVNNYFSSLEAGEAAESAPNVDAPEEQPTATSDESGSIDDVGPDSGGQSGDTQNISDVEDSNSESETELLEEGQSFEAEVVNGVENAPPADEAEVTTRRTSG